MIIALNRLYEIPNNWNENVEGILWVRDSHDEGGMDNEFLIMRTNKPSSWTGLVDSPHCTAIYGTFGAAPVACGMDVRPNANSCFPNACQRNPILLH